MKGIDAMTLEECRDEIAWHLGGWTNKSGESVPWIDNGVWWRGDPSNDYSTLPVGHHPIPRTIEAIAATMPQGWSQSIEFNMSIQNPDWSTCAFRGKWAVYVKGDSELLVRGAVGVRVPQKRGAP